MIRLELEKKALGVYLSMHPLAYLKQKLQVPVIAIARLNEYFINAYKSQSNC